MRDLKGKTAVITGGASGIGLASARAMAAEDMRLVFARFGRVHVVFNNAGVAISGPIQYMKKMQGRVLGVEDVAAKVVAAVKSGQLYIHTHEEARPFIQRRFERINGAFD